MVQKFPSSVGELIALADLDGYSKANPRSRGSIAANTNRGAINYGYLSSLFPQHVKTYVSMRQRSEIECDYPHTLEGFSQFVLDIGPVPEEMIWPTIGRSDHSKGYTAGNFSWQEHFDNVGEAASRTKTGKEQPTIKNTPTHRRSEDFKRLLMEDPSPISHERIYEAMGVTYNYAQWYHRAVDLQNSGLPIVVKYQGELRYFTVTRLEPGE